MMQGDPMIEPAGGRRLGAAEIEQVVFDAMRATNLARDPGSQLEVASRTELLGGASLLDSLGLLALLLDIEEGLRFAGCEVSLSDDRAMSQKRSPFRTVATLVAYIEGEANL